MARVTQKQVQRMAAEFLNRLNADPKFAKRFDKDPAAAAKEIFPELKGVPKKKIAQVLDAHEKSVNSLLKIAKGSARPGGPMFDAFVINKSLTARVVEVAKVVVTAVVTAVLQGPIGRKVPE